MTDQPDPPPPGANPASTTAGPEATASDVPLGPDVPVGSDVPAGSDDTAGSDLRADSDDSVGSDAPVGSDPPVGPDDAVGSGLVIAEADVAATDVGVAPDVPATQAATEPDEAALRLAEALVFASTTPVGPRTLSQLLPPSIDADAVIDALRARYAGRGIELVDTGGGLQFRTAQDLAPRLRKVIEVPRRLPRVAMETLAIVAYHQPVTRPEIEEIRGASLSQQTLDTLLEANLVAPQGRRDSPGRPTLWGTTPQFLAQFGLRDIRDLPRRDDLLVEPPQPPARGSAAEGSAAGNTDVASSATGSEGSEITGG